MLKSLRFFTACFISLALHSMLGVTLFTTGVLKGPSPPPRLPKHLLQQKNIFLEFLPTTPTSQELKHTTPTHIIAEKDTVAQNPVSKPNLPKGDPYQKGTVDQASLERRQTTDERRETREKRQKTEVRSQESGDKRQETEDRRPQHSVLSPRLSGTDNFSAPAKKNLTSTADILSEWSYNAKSHAIAQYFSKEFKKISNIWHMELYASQDFASGVSFDLKKTVVIFRIMPDGHIEDLKIIEHIGTELAQRYPIIAIEKAAPFTPLPRGVLAYIRTEGLWVKIEFNYN